MTEMSNCDGFPAVPLAPDWRQRRANRPGGKAEDIGTGWNNELSMIGNVGGDGKEEKAERLKADIREWIQLMQAIHNKI